MIRGAVFHAGTSIQYDLPKASHLRIEVCSILGQQIRIPVAGPLPGGSHLVRGDRRMNAGETAPSGLSICRMVAGDATMNKKMVVLPQIAA